VQLHVIVRKCENYHKVRSYTLTVSTELKKSHKPVDPKTAMAVAKIFAEHLSL
jgi:hypothetical protein